MAKSSYTSSTIEINSFYTHKRKFFDNKPAFSQSEIKNLAGQMTSKELFDYQEEINQEFNDLSASIGTMSVEDNTEQFFYFSLYCCYLLENYHAACGNYYKQQDFKEKAAQLIDQLAKVSNKNDAHQKKEFFSHLSKTFSETWRELQLSINQPSKFSQKVGLINLSRIEFVLSRFSLSKIFLILEENKVLEQLAKLLNREISSAKLIERMNMFNGILNALSVAMFGSRLLRNVAATFYFTFFPTEEARNAKNSILSRLYHQLYERKGELLNDTVWTAVNALTNYQLFGMSAMAAMGITAGFMFFDVAVLIYLKYCEEKIFVKKQQQYQKEINTLLNQLSENSLTDEMRESLSLQLKVLETQKLMNQVHWRQTAAVYHFQIFAAVLLATGFSFSLLVASPYVVVACYTLCLLAASMYFNSGDYGKLQGIKAKRDNAESLHLDRAKLEAEYQNAQFTLAINLVKNAVLPPIMIGTFLLCWEAGLALLVSYLIVEGIRYYQQNKSEQPALEQEASLEGSLAY